jgi:low affinity Fe/Cu permease
VNKFINDFAAFLSTTSGFIATFIILLIGITIGVLLGFEQTFMTLFNIFLSVAAIVISGIILVSAARSEAAVHVKLDHLIEVSEATDRAIGLEHKEAREIEAEREAIEEKAKRELEGIVEEEVDEALAEQKA